MRRWLVCLILVCCSFNAEAELPPFAIGIQPQYGFLIAHRPSIVHLIHKHVPSFELYAEKPVSGKKDWHNLYNQPNIGISLFAGNLGNKRVIGNGYAVMHYAKFHIIREQKFSWNFRIASGLGYVEKIFDPLDNNKNIAIGSHFNIAFSLGNYFKFSTQKADFGTGFSITHFSNGAFSMPNLGMNIPSIFLFYNWKHGNHEIQTTPVERKEHRPILHAGIVGSAGLKEVNPPGTSKYGTFAVESFLINHFSPKSGLGCGMDVMYTYSNVEKFRQHVGDPGDPLTFIQVGMHADYEMNLDNLKLFINFGGYLLSKYKEDGFFYHRFGLRYYFENNLIAGFSLKTHWAKADFFSLGIGYRFLKK